jgi:DNA polymerase-3 subunit delta'
MHNLPLDIDFYGNKDLIKNIGLCISSNSINSFLIGGDIGLGKLNLIMKLSKFLLCHYENFKNSDLKEIIFNDDNFFKKIKSNKSSYLFDNNVHPDFFYLSLNKNLDEKIIPIDNVRKLNIFFHKTFSVSKIKIAVINSIDNLSINSLNSLLKIIEEPPENSFIFLISHKPMNILKTITSRCSVFNLKPLDKETFDIFLLNHIKSSSEDELLFIKDISNRSPGLALKINDKEIFKSYLNLLDDLMCSNKYLNIRNSLMKLYFIKNNDEVFLLFVLRLMIVNLIKKVVFYQFENNFLKSTLTKEQDFINFIVKKNSKLNLLKLYSKFDKDMNSALLLNVNKSDVTMNFLKDLCLT